jgi:hypothetical protein
MVLMVSHGIHQAGFDYAFVATDESQQTKSALKH